jgi:hypothetical protein
VDSEIHLDHIKILNLELPNVLLQLEALLYVVRKLRTLVGLGQFMRVLGEMNKLGQQRAAL